MLDNLLIPTIHIIKNKGPDMILIIRYKIIRASPPIGALNKIKKSLNVSGNHGNDIPIHANPMRKKIIESSVK
jgi:hypothetical protein